MRYRFTTLLLIVLLAAACGGTSGAATGAHTTPVSLTLDWYANADHVGVYTGIDRGFFARAGLDVTARPPSAASDSITLVATGRSDLGISYEPEVFYAQQRHIPVVAVASVVPRALASIIAAGASGIRTPADLRGKTIGIDGTASTTAFVQTVLRHSGVDPSDVKLVNVGFNQVPALLQHKVDAVAGVFQNIEGIQFAQQGLHPVVFPYDRYGVPQYDELVIVANASRMHSDAAYRRTVARFVTALAAATRWAQAHPGDAIAVMEHHAYRDYQGTIRRSVPATLALLRTAPLNPTAWARFGEWMYRSGLLKQRPDAAALVARP
ncbi:MAG TPA: ABC transporter substrate-binding protein [Gaiellales bacterium]|jgi:putative hydroxymethylpyrimidine transport system substrate-binding protein